MGFFQRSPRLKGDLAGPRVGGFTTFLGRESGTVFGEIKNTKSIVLGNLNTRNHISDA